MVDTLKLEYLIKKSGRTNAEVATELGLSLQGFLNKTHNKTEFKYSEIRKLAELCDVSVEDHVFFEN